MVIANKARFTLLIIGVIHLLAHRVHSAPFCEECAPFIPGAVAYWPMTSETKGSDLSGNKNPATFVGLTYTDGPSGEENGAVHFNGDSNSYAKVTNYPSMDVGKYPGFSFCGFVRYLGLPNTPGSLIDWSSVGGYGVFIVVASKQIIQLHLYPMPGHDSINHKAEFPNLKLTKGAWHFIGVSYDKATGKATMFKDGQLEAKQLGKNIIAGNDKTSDHEVGLGIDMYDKTRFNYDGDMSCMMLFKVALTADDFKRVMDFCRTTQSTQTTLPSITVSDIAATRATASWTTSPGIFSGYNITIERRPSGLDQEFAHPPYIPASVMFPKSVVLTDLVPGATYRVRVWHMERHLVGRARSSSWFNTEPSLVVESDSIIFSEITATSASVSWTDVTGDYDGYSVDISPTTGGAKADPSTVPRGTTTTSLLNLAAGRSYIVRIRTKIGSKTSSPSMNVLHTLGLPSATPSSVSTTLDIRWILLIIIALVLAIFIPIAVVFIFCRRNTLRSSNGNNKKDSSEMKPLKRKAKKKGATVMRDLKKRYQKDYWSIFLLPYRQDRVTDINQLSRNFEKRTIRGYEDVTLEDIFEDDDGNHKSNRYVLEALSGYGRSSLMKKLAYMWATGNKKLNRHFKLVFLISTDNFIEFQKKDENRTGNHLEDFVSSEYFFSNQDIESGHNREIWRLVQKNEETVLFIIDTNYESELPDDLHKLFFGKTMQDSTVILTSRTNQVPTMIRDQAHMFTFIRIAKHHPATIKSHILEYFDNQGKRELGKALVQKLRIENWDHQEIRYDVKLSWITTPFMLNIIAIVWQDIWEAGDEDEKESFCLDEPYIYQTVVKNIFKYYACCEGGILTRVNHAVEGKTFDHETLTLGRLAWGLIEKNKSSIPAEELGSLKDGEGEANVLRNSGVLRPKMIAEGGIQKEKYMFTDEICKFYFAARFIRNEMDQGKKEDKDIQNAVERVRSLNKNIDELFKKFIEM